MFIHVSHFSLSLYVVFLIDQSQLVINPYEVFNDLTADGFANSLEPHQTPSNSSGQIPKLFATQTIYFQHLKSIDRNFE